MIAFTAPETSSRRPLRATALALGIACVAVLAVVAPAHASSCVQNGNAVVVAMPGSLDSVDLHRVGDAIYNGAQPCGGATVYNTDVITVNDTTSGDDGDDAVGIDLSGGPLAPGITNEGPGGVSEIEMWLFLAHGTNSVWLTGSAGADNIHAGVLPQGGGEAKGINLNAGAEQGKVPDVDMIYYETNPPTSDPITFQGGAGDDTFDATGGGGFTGISFQPVTLLGGNGDDHLVGGAGNDTLYADAGNDVLDGYQGLDTVTYQLSPGPATVDLSGQAPQDTGALGSDQIHRIELLTGSPYDDVLTGSDTSNLIQGGGGDDVLAGRGDTDRLDGGPGSDTATYRPMPAGATQGVTVNLGIAGPQNTVAAGSDTLEGIENLAGTPFADDLTGDGQANTLTGWEGEDSLRGEGGDDRVAARDGTRDLVACGAGADSVDADQQSVDSIFGDCETTAFAPFVPPPGGATGTGPAGSTAPAKASFFGSRSSIRVDRHGRFRFSFHAGPRLTGRAVFGSVRKVRLSRTSSAARRVTIARRPFTVQAGGEVTLRVKLSAKNLRVLKLNRRIRTRVTVTLANPTGLTSKATKLIALRAPKR